MSKDEKPTKEEKVDFAKKLHELNKEREMEFIRKYNMLCEEYQMTIQPKVTVTVARKS